ncbi:hypothetical protein ACLB2K_056391 [Fragaria x ananassa]
MILSVPNVEDDYPLESLYESRNEHGQCTRADGFVLSSFEFFRFDWNMEVVESSLGQFTLLGVGDKKVGFLVYMFSSGIYSDVRSDQKGNGLILITDMRLVFYHRCQMTNIIPSSVHFTNLYLI